jgi:hypothetical protein
LAMVFEILHRYNVVVGDVSGRNILWSRRTGDSVMLIDCDGCRIDKTIGVTRSKQSPEWFDPHLTGPTDIESDLYKLSIAIYRGYFSHSLGSPAQNTVPLVNSADREIQSLSLRGVGTSPRPTASEWVNTISNLITETENDGRPVISLWQTVPAPIVTPVAPRPSVVPSDNSRPSIDWKS